MYNVSTCMYTFCKLLVSESEVSGANPFKNPSSYLNNREVKHDVYGKRQTAKIELLVSDFSRLYNLGKLFAFTVIKGFFSLFFDWVYLSAKEKVSKIRIIFAVCRKRHA